MDAAKIHRRAVYRATKYGFSEHAQDLAQAVLLKFAKGGGKHQTIDQAVIDAIRARFGSVRQPGYAQKHALETAGSIDRDGGESSLPNAVGKPPGDGIDFDRIIGMLGGVERACLVLRFKWGLEEIEIGECFGFTESRASQLLSKAIDTVAMIVSDGRVEKKIGAEESRKCDREGCSNMAEAGQTYCSFECAVKKRGEP